ncbi:MAG: hypothetical protein OHK0024_04640 [Thalassobaculales bacterium]
MPSNDHSPEPCQPALHPSERPISSLRFAEQFVVWAVRRWVAHRGDLAATWPLLREGFTKAGAGGGLVPLHEALTALGTASREPLDVRCETCPGLGEGEALILAILTAFQANDLDGGVAMLRSFLPPAAVRIAGVQLCLLAESLSDAGLRLAAAPAAAAARPVASGRGLSLVH